ncbi:MAG: DUF11 domain-containing protein [Pirellulaceae bacterium]|jgi:uncharacterized repeat protein (TIGR01451 family)|nr:DUF11 domain-containing protein [Pirellulaceae bacterium]
MRAGQGEFERENSGDQLPLFAAARPQPIVGRILGPFCQPIWLVLLCGTFALSNAGCARFQLPAIDPNGSRIFLPFPNTTQLTLPSLHGQNGGAGLIPNPAFTTPVTPPPCVDGSCNTAGSKHQLLKQHKLGHKLDKHFPSQGKAGEIQLTPTRIVAPVGGEVVLLAGICGPRGYLVNRQPLEWMLSPDSVGTFIEVGDDSPGHLISSFTMHKAPKVEKLDVDFAKGRTSSKETVIDRGSPNCDDDIHLKEGQTWLSISSPSEGVSRVTVLAPESDIWDRRRQTATIYWVDAQWEFPQPLIARSGDPLQFVTRVTKSDALVPAEDWIVQYTIVDPSIATFVPPTGSNVARIKVNRDAQAIAQVVAAVDAQGRPARGTTPILIDVIRPAQPSDNLPELKLGSGQTFATFSSPGLDLQAFGNDVGSVGEQISYVASLGNPGDVPAENTQLVMNIPAGTRLVSAVPQPTTTTNTGLVWDQGALDAHRQLDVSVVLEALRPGTFDVSFQAAAAGNLSAASSVRTNIVEASVDLRFEPISGAAQAEIGQLIEYAIDIKNTSPQTLTDLRVAIESDPGLPEAETGRNEVEKSIRFLQPGSTQPMQVNFVVRQAGQLGAMVKIYAGQNLLAERSTSVLGVEPAPKRPDVGIRIEFPESIRVGSSNNATVILRNPGEVKLTGMNVELAWDPTLRARFVDSNNNARFRLSADGRSAVWDAQDLLPPVSRNSGESIRTLTLSFESMAPVTQGSITARVAAAEGVQANDAISFRAVASQVSPPGSPPVSPPTLPPNTGNSNGSPQTLPPVNPPPMGNGLGSQPRTGEWEIKLSDYGDPTIVGNPVRYQVTIRNNQNQNDSDVRIELLLPQGVQFGGATSLVQAAAVDTTFGPDNSVLFAPINSVRAGETLDYVFVLVPQVPDVMLVRARVYSAAQGEPRYAEQDTTVLPKSN